MLKRKTVRVGDVFQILTSQGQDPMWFFWSGQAQWKIDGPLSDLEKKYPKGLSLPSAPLLIERIENDFRVERDYI